MYAEVCVCAVNIDFLRERVTVRMVSTLLLLGFPANTVKNSSIVMSVFNVETDS